MKYIGDEIKEKVEEVKDNLIQVAKGNKDYNYDIITDYKIYDRILIAFSSQKERLQALIMLYVVNVKLEELENWTIKDLETYILDTVEDEYIEDYQRLLNIVRKGNKEIACLNCGNLCEIKNVQSDMLGNYITCQKCNATFNIN